MTDERIMLNPLRQRLEEIAQALNQSLRSIPDFVCLPVSVTHAFARQDVNLVATVLETGDSQRFLHDFMARAQDRLQRGLSKEALLQGLDCLEQTVTPRVVDLDAARLVWQSLSQARFALGKQNGSNGRSAATEQADDLATPKQAATLVKSNPSVGRKGGTGPLGRADYNTQLELLKLVLGHIPQAVFWKDRDLVYLGCNLEFAKDAGLTSVDEIVGKTDFDMPWREQAELYRSDDRAVLESGVAKLDYEEPQTTPEGNIIWLRTSKIPMRDPQGNIFAVLGMYEDITPRKQAEEAILREKAHAEALLAEQKRLEAQLQQTLERRGFQVQVSTQIAQEIAMAPDLRTLFQSVVTLVKERFDYYHVQLLRYEPALNAVILVAGYGDVGQSMLQAGHQLPLGTGLIGTAAALGETQLRPSVAADPDWRSNPLLPDTKGEIAVPIKLRDQVLGVLDVQSDREGVLGEDDRLLLEGLCGQIAVAIESTRLRREMEERLHELDLLYRSSHREGWNEFIQRIQGCNAYLYENLEVRPIGDGDRQGGDADPADWAEPKADILVPLSIRGQIIGELGVFDDPIHPLSEGERKLVEQVSDQVAQALESARLYEQTQASLAETQMMYTGSARIIASGTLDEILKALVETTRLNELDQVIIELFDRPWETEPPETMVNAAVWEREGVPSKESVGSVYHMRELPFLSMMDRSLPLVVKDMLTDERVDPATREVAVDQLGIRGQVFWPMVAGGQWFGALSGQSGKPLTLEQQDIRRIGSLVAQAATAIQSLKLQQEMRSRLQELTALQRLMSREAWSAYQAQLTDEARGYVFNQVELLPVRTASMQEQESRAGLLMDDNNSGYVAPLEVRGEPIGALGVKLDVSRSLTEEEEAFLQAVSEQVAQALERARLMEQTQKSAVELQAVAEVGTATATILDPEQLLQQVVDLTKERFGLYHAHIYLVDEAGENLVLTVGAGEVGRSMTAQGWSIPITLEDSLVARAARTRQGQVANDVRRESGYLPNPLLLDTLSEMAVPMIIGDRLLGVFDVQSDKLNHFHEEDVRIYSTLAAQIAVALQNAKLYAEQLATVERLRELDNMKSAFLANMSHELRTPLNSILGFTQVIMEGLDGPLTEVMLADLELIEKNGKHLLNLINEVLDMAKIDSGRLSLNPEPVDLYELMEDVIGTSAPLAREKDLFVKLEAAPAEDWRVMADQVRMRQIFLNLIGNAIKFTEAGGVTITMNKVRQSAEAGSDLVQLRIQDTGIGIPRNKLDEIFEAFTQVDSSTTRKVGGTGLGLPISRRLVEMHGGRLWAESEGIGKGATFVLELPVGESSANSTEAY
jgi:PAS domain S-box-containing protein